MKRLLAGLAITLALAVPAAASAGGPDAAALEAELVCPTCRTTLDQSNAPVARRMKEIIRERLAAGATAEEIKEELVAQFGPGVLASPPREGLDLLAWALPIAFVSIGAVGVGLVVTTWRRRRVPFDTDGAPPGADFDDRIDDALSRFDG